MSTAQKRAHPSELTNKIKAFRARFEKYRATGIQASPDGVAMLIGELDDILAQAWEFKEELSALRWNRMGRSATEQDLIEMTLANLADPASNVVPLSRDSLPITDGGQSL